MLTIAVTQDANGNSVPVTPFPADMIALTSDGTNFTCYQKGDTPPVAQGPLYPDIAQQAAVALTESDKFVRIAVETQAPMSSTALAYRATLRTMLSGNVSGPLPTEPSS